MSLISLIASSLVCSPHSDSCVAILTRSLAADSWAEIRLFSDLISRNSRRDSSGWIVPRSDENENPLRLPLEETPPPLLRLLDRMDRARFLGAEALASEF